MKIPIKKYDPPEFRLRELIDLLTQYPASYDGSDARAIAHEYTRLLKHHEEETKFLIARVQELEAQLEKPECG